MVIDFLLEHLQEIQIITTIYSFLFALFSFITAFSRAIRRKRKNTLKILSIILILTTPLSVLSINTINEYEKAKTLEETVQKISNVKRNLVPILKQYHNLVDICQDSSEINQPLLNTLLNTVDNNLKTLSNIALPSNSDEWVKVYIYQNDIRVYLITIKSSLEYFKQSRDSSIIEENSLNALKYTIYLHSEHEKIEKMYTSNHFITDSSNTDLISNDSLDTDEAMKIVNTEYETYLNWSIDQQQKNRWKYLRAWNMALLLLIDSDNIELENFKSTISEIDPSSYLFDYKLRDNKIFKLLEGKYEQEMGFDFIHRFYSIN